MTVSDHWRRLVIVDTEMGRVVGGAQTFLLRLLPELRRRGWAATVVCETPDPPFASELRAGGVEVANLVLKYPRIVEDSATRLARWANSLHPAAYVVSVSSGSGWAAMPLLEPGIPTLALIHSDDEAFYRPLTHYRNVTDMAVAVSEPIYGRLVSGLGIDRARACHVPYGVDKRVERTSFGGPLRVAFIGRLSEHDKQIGILARAIAQLRDEPIDFIIAGDGPDATDFRRLLGQHHRAQLLGHLAPEASVTALESADCLVLTSTGREGMPLAVLEARACGVVPVLSDIPAHAALVEHDIDGLLVPAGDMEALVSALRMLAKDAERLAKLAEMSYRRADRTTVGAMTSAFEAAVERAAAVAQGEGARPAVPLMESCTSRWPTPARKVRDSARRLLHASRRAAS